MAEEVRGSESGFRKLRFQIRLHASVAVNWKTDKPRSTPQLPQINKTGAGESLAALASNDNVLANRRIANCDRRYRQAPVSWKIKELGATMIDHRRGTLIGLAVGDALGAAVEFMPPGSFAPMSGY